MSISKENFIPLQWAKWEEKEPFQPTYKSENKDLLKRIFFLERIFFFLKSIFFFKTISNFWKFRNAWNFFSRSNLKKNNFLPEENIFCFSKDIFFSFLCVWSKKEILRFWSLKLCQIAFSKLNPNKWWKMMKNDNQILHYLKL